MQWFVTEDGKYRIENLSAATIPGALEVIRVAFCQDESACIGTEVNKNVTAIEELLELCADAILDGVSLVAVDIETGEVVSAAINKLQVQSGSEKPFFEIFAEERCTQSSSQALINLMAELDGRANMFDVYGVDCSLEIMFLATYRHHRNRKLGYLLCKYSIEVARKLKNGPLTTITLQDLGSKYSNIPPREITTKHPKICQALWSSKPTQKIGKSLGFTIHLCVSFEDYVYNGKTYVERIGYNPFCHAAAMKLY